jgi:hypothetical protein
MKVLKNYKKRAIQFRNDARLQIATDKTIIADIVENIANEFVVTFNGIDYVKAYDIYSKDSIQIYFSGLPVLSQYVKDIKFYKTQIVLTFDNSDNYFVTYSPEMITIKGKFIDSYLVTEDDIWLATEDNKDIIF